MWEDFFFRDVIYESNLKLQLPNASGQMNVEEIFFGQLWDESRAAAAA